MWIGFLLLFTHFITTNGFPNPQGTEVCGTDGWSYKNEEALKSAQSNLRDLQMLYPGPCLKAFQQRSLLRSQPTCGSDGKTYETYRDLMLAKLKQPDLNMVYSEPCPKDFKKQKPPEEDLTRLRSVLNTIMCGTDFRNYYTYKELEWASLKDPYLKISHRGPCVVQLLRTILDDV